MNPTLPVGPPVPGWTARPRPPRAVIQGRFCRLEPLSADIHADALFDANALDREERMWTYLFGGPYRERAEYRAYLEKCEASEDPLFFAIVDARLDRATGTRHRTCGSSPRTASSRSVTSPSRRCCSAPPRRPRRCT